MRCSGRLAERCAQCTHQRGGVAVLPGERARATQPSGRMSNASRSTRSVRAVRVLTRPVQAAVAPRASARSTRPSRSPRPSRSRFADRFTAMSTSGSGRSSVNFMSGHRVPTNRWSSPRSYPPGVHAGERVGDVPVCVVEPTRSACFSRCWSPRPVSRTPWPAPSCSTRLPASTWKTPPASPGPGDSRLTQAVGGGADVPLADAPPASRPAPTRPFPPAPKPWSTSPDRPDGMPPHRRDHHFLAQPDIT